MGCGTDPSATAEECAIACWSPALTSAGLFIGRERNGQWRANCPVPGCGASRSLEYDAPGKHVRWKSFCSEHDKEAVRPYLKKLIGACMPSGGRREAIRHDELIELALAADLSPQSLKLGLLEMAGMTTGEALRRLGIGPTHRQRVIGPLRKLGRLRLARRG